MQCFFQQPLCDSGQVYDIFANMLGCFTVKHVLSFAFILLTMELRKTKFLKDANPINFEDETMHFIRLLHEISFLILVTVNCRIHFGRANKIPL